MVDKNTPWDGDYACINSFGFGGANGHVLLKSHKRPKPQIKAKKIPRLVCVSGRTSSAVDYLIDNVSSVFVYTYF